MAAKLRLQPRSFKDYFLIMQIHPEADGGMVDAAYWHLARRYNDAAKDDPSAKAKLDDLNEAYSVLGAAAHREEYEKLREQVLGKGALPSAALPNQPAPPLTVMQRQRARPRDDAEDEAPTRKGWPVRFRVPAWQNALAALILLALAGVALVSQVYAPLVIGLLIVGLALTSMPLVRGMPRFAAPPLTPAPASAGAPAAVVAAAPSPAPRSKPHAGKGDAEPPPTPRPKPPQGKGDADSLRDSTGEMVARLRSRQPPDDASAAPPPQKE